jgi:hypothetical protein
MVPGVVLVEFDHGKLASLGENITKEDILSTEVSRTLQQYGLEGGRRIFRNARTSDTLAVARSGETVHLLDLTRWYKLKVADTTNVLDLADRLRLIHNKERSCLLESQLASSF